MTSPNATTPENDPSPTPVTPPSSRWERPSFDPATTLAWDGPRLVVTDQALLDRCNRPALSPSSSKAIQGCAARWVGEQVCPSPENLLGPAEVGTDGHTVMERLFWLPSFTRTKRNARKILAELAEEKFPADSPAEHLALREEWTAKVWVAIEGLWVCEDPTTVDLHGTEMQLPAEANVNGVPIIGYIDRLDNEPGGGLKVVDFKTGKRRTENDDQMRLYVAALRSVGINAVRAVLYYTATGKVFEVDLSEEKMAYTVDAYVRSWNSLQSHLHSSTFPTKVTALCGWCPLVNLCPAAQNAEKTDRKGGALVEAVIPHYPSPATQSGAAAGHITGTGPITPGDPTMTNTQIGPQIADERPYYETHRGLLNGSSYAATAVFGITALAYEKIVEANLPLSPAAVDALASTFDQMVTTVAAEFDPSISKMHGLHTRVRGLLRTYIETHPVPFNGDAATWESWTSLGVRHLRSLTRASLRLYTGEATAPAPGDLAAIFAPAQAPAPVEAPAEDPAPVAATAAA